MTSLLRQSVHLIDLWNRLSNQHIVLGCSCVMGGVSVRLEDFERDIADYLWAESARLGQTEVEAFLLENGPIESLDQAVRTILARLQAGEASQEVTQWLLSRLTKTIESYAQLHGPAASAPLLGGSKAWRKSYRD
jgi:hypothetical protein